MTQYTPEQTQRQKLKGCVQGVVAAVISRLPKTDAELLAKLETELGQVVKPLLDRAIELGEEQGKTTPAKELVALTTDVHQAVNEFLAKHTLTPKEMPVIGNAIRVMVQEAHQAGWEK